MISRFSATTEQYLLYVVIYFGLGLLMNAIGRRARIAEFKHWWQVATCYVLYLLPASLFVRSESYLLQWLCGFVVLAPLEILGFALGTSIAHDGNLIDRVVGPRNFTLVMVVLFSPLLLAGNAAIAWLDAVLFSR